MAPTYRILQTTSFFSCLWVHMEMFHTGNWRYYINFTLTRKRWYWVCTNICVQSTKQSISNIKESQSFISYIFCYHRPFSRCLEIFSTRLFKAKLLELWHALTGKYSRVNSRFKMYVIRKAILCAPSLLLDFQKFLKYVIQKDVVSDKINIHKRSLFLLKVVTNENYRKTLLWWFFSSS